MIMCFFFVSSKPGAHVFSILRCAQSVCGAFPGSKNIHFGRHQPHLWLRHLRLEVGEKHLLRPFNDLDLKFFS